MTDNDDSGRFLSVTLTVHELETTQQFSGLLDAQGYKLYRQSPKQPLGFLWNPNSLPGGGNAAAMRG